MKIYLYTILALLFLPAYTTLALPSSADKKLQELDTYLEQKATYDKQKENAIQQRKDILRKAKTPAEQYKASIGLYEEYKSHKFDSAYHYANRSLHLAYRIVNRDCQVEAGCAMAFCLLSAGLYKEAFDYTESINTEGASNPYKKKYYDLVIRLNYAISDYNHASPFYDQYVKRGNIYTDSILSLIKPKSTEWWYFTGQRQMKMFEYDKGIASFKEVLKQKNIDMHLKAIVTSCIGWMKGKKGKKDEAIYYLAESACCDIIASTKETTALCGLAELLYTEGDMHRSYQYVQLSLDDANFYDARQRKIETGSILPIIEQSRYNLMKSQRNTLVTAVSIVSVVIIAMLVMLIMLLKARKKERLAQQLTAESNRKLRHTNDQLQEANKIKNEYIGNFFYINSEFIEKMEKLYRTIDRKIETRQYEDLRYSIKESLLHKERDNMFAVFDSTFLKIFPNFVEHYNKLFEEKDRKTPEKELSLTTEMRIFALIRLGINDSERIAKFLNYSVHTINTYKTRVKKKSIVENDLFEKRIMEIEGIG